MSNYKEGEGCWMVDVDPFTSTEIIPGEKYEVIVLVGGDVVDRTMADASLSLSDAESTNEYFLYCHDGETVSLLSRSRIFLTHYPQKEDWDVIIKELDGKTVKMLPNVKTNRV